MQTEDDILRRIEQQNVGMPSHQVHPSEKSLDDLIGDFNPLAITILDPRQLDDEHSPLGKFLAERQIGANDNPFDLPDNHDTGSDPSILMSANNDQLSM